MSGDIINGLFDSFNTIFIDIWDKAVYPILQNFVTAGLPMITEFATQTNLLIDDLFNTLKDGWVQSGKMYFVQR